MAFNYDGMIVQLVSVHNQNLVVDVGGAQSKNGAPILLWSPNAGKNQSWRVCKRAGAEDRFCFRPMHATSMALDMTGHSHRQCHLWTFDEKNDNQFFSLEPSAVQQGAVVIRSHLGTVLDVEMNSGGGEGAKLLTFEENRGKNQCFFLRPDMNMMMSEPQLMAGFPGEGAIVRLVNGADQSLVVHVREEERGDEKDPGSTEKDDDNDKKKKKSINLICSMGSIGAASSSSSQTWRCHRQGGTVAFHPLHVPHLALTASSGGSSSPCRILPADSNNDPNQRFVCDMNPSAAGFFVIRCAQSGAVLEMAPNNHRVVQTAAPKVGAANQAWEIRWAQ